MWHTGTTMLPMINKKTLVTLILLEQCPKFHENCASSFWAMRQSMYVHNCGPCPQRVGRGCYPFRKIRKSQEHSHSNIIIVKKDWQCKAGRGRLTPYQSKDPSPTLPAYRGKEDKGENSSRQKRREQLGQQKGIGSALETHQSHTIKYGVNQIVPERYWEGNKSPAVLRGSAAGRCKNIPMCDQSTACNPDWHIRQR